MSNEQDIFGFDLLFGVGTLVAGSPPTDPRYTGNVRSIIDTTRVAATPAAGVSPTRPFASITNAEYSSDGPVLLALFRVGPISKWWVLGETIDAEVCDTP